MTTFIIFNAKKSDVKCDVHDERLEAMLSTLEGGDGLRVALADGREFIFYHDNDDEQED